MQTLRASILRLGFSTAREIGTERYALKALRGDFGRPYCTDRLEPHSAHSMAFV